MNLTEAKEFFKNDAFATSAAGIEILAVGENYAKCGFEIKDIHRNAVGGVIGGAVFTLADFTFAVAANVTAQSATVTVTSTINYLAPCKGKSLIAESRLLKDGKSLCFYRIDITDENGNPVATVNTTGKHC